MTDTPTPTTPGRVVHVADKIPDAVYIGRAMPRQRLKASPFANPYKINLWYSGIERYASRADVVMLYRHDITRGPNRHLLADLPTLRGKPLACWCRHDGEARIDSDQYHEGNNCHGDVLVDLLNRYTDDELRAMAT